MNISVNMTGKEYMQYKESRKIKFTKKQKEATIIFSMCGIGVFILAMLMDSLTSTPYQGMGYLASGIIYMRAFTTVELLKLGAILAFPFIIISWVLHGVQFKILA